MRKAPAHDPVEGKSGWAARGDGPGRLDESRRRHTGAPPLQTARRSVRFAGCAAAGGPATAASLRRSEDERPSPGTLEREATEA